MPTQARLIHEVGTQVFLRRYAAHGTTEGYDCPWAYGHAAKVHVADLDGKSAVLAIASGKGDYADDPRWPTHCSCGYAFGDDDEWRVSVKRHYDTASGCPEPGDLYWVDGGLSRDRQKWEETPHLYAICPDGRAWDIDGPSSNGNDWTRTGDPPAITCSPSIWTDMPHGYHGFLQGGVFTDDLSGKVFDAQPYGYM